MFYDNLLTINISKCKFILFGSNQRLKKVQDINIHVDLQEIENAKSFKYLGVIIKQNMRWADHVDYLCTKVSQGSYWNNKTCEEFNIISCKTNSVQ